MYHGKIRVVSMNVRKHINQKKLVVLLFVKSAINAAVIEAFTNIYKLYILLLIYALDIFILHSIYCQKNTTK